jgi:hypothetical protein
LNNLLLTSPAGWRLTQTSDCFALPTIACCMKELYKDKIIAAPVPVQTNLVVIWGCQEDEIFAKPLTVLSFKIICALCPTAHPTYYFN